MAIPLLQIPGNIKQQFTPFVINPNSPLHKYVGSSTSLNAAGCSPQFFSYRNPNIDYGSGNAHLQFYPSSLDRINFNDDISLKLLYARNNGKPIKESLTIEDIVNCIPGVSIREFLPDTRLDQCINMFVDLVSNMTKVFSDDKKSITTQANGEKQQQQSTTEESWADKFKKVMAVTWYTMKYMVGATDPNFFDDLKTGLNVPFANYKSDVYLNTSNGNSQGFYVMTFPYTLYYRLQSCVTTNVYEVPGILQDKRIISSNGSAGWTSGGDMLSEGGFRVSGLLSKIPIIGSMANMILGNIGINYMPWWNADAGSKTKEPEIVIKFDLFNDNEMSALWNFIFVNTIVSGNKWLQYNMFQHSSNLYDVKIEGVNRLFACAGDFNVTYEGVLRDPPESWVRMLANEHLNQNINSAEFLANALKGKLIKIPDVYRVELKFQSLLPANFNNYIFAYAQKASHIDKNDSVYQQSVVAEVLPNALSKYTERVAKVWDAGSAAAADDTLKNAGVSSYDELAKKQEKEAAAQKAKEVAEAQQAQVTSVQDTQHGQSIVAK